MANSGAAAHEFLFRETSAACHSAQVLPLVRRAAASGSRFAASTCSTVFLFRGVIRLRSSPASLGDVSWTAPVGLAPHLQSLSPTLHSTSCPQSLPCAVYRALADWQPPGEAAHCCGPSPQVLFAGRSHRRGQQQHRRTTCYGTCRVALDGLAPSRHQRVLWCAAMG